MTLKKASPYPIILRVSITRSERNLSGDGVYENLSPMDLLIRDLRDIGTKRLDLEEQLAIGGVIRRGREAQEELLSCRPLDSDLGTVKGEELKSAIQKGIGAQHWLVLCSMRIVVKEAVRLRSFAVRSGLSCDDLIQEGTLLLLQAARTYSDKHGATFISYVGPALTGSMKELIWANGILTGGVVKVSRRLQQLIFMEEVEGLSRQEAGGKLGLSDVQLGNVKAIESAPKDYVALELPEVAEKGPTVNNTDSVKLAEIDFACFMDYLGTQLPPLYYQVVAIRFCLDGSFTYREVVETLSLPMTPNALRLICERKVYPAVREIYQRWCNENPGTTY